MLIHVNDAVTLQGARALRQPLIIPYGIHQEYELQIVTGHDNRPVDVESRGCVKWTLTVTPSPENPTKVLAYAVFAENIATGSYLRFDFAATSVEMYKHVAGNPATPAVLQLQGFTEEDAPATLVVTLPVALVTTAQQRLPVDLSTALMQELQLAVSVVGAAQRSISKYAGDSTDAADRAEQAAINAHASEVNAEHSATAAGVSAGNARESETAAETAQGKAETAQGKAEDAQTAAEAAQDAAETAQGKAEDAQAAAETAEGKAEDAQAAAETAQGKAEDAQAAAEAAQTAAETAQGKAEDAQAAAEAAQTAAETAQGKAEDAQTAAETAQGKAEDAQQAAETAQGLAEDAKTAAETAQGKAEDAQTAAETAQGKAEDAQTAAETAQTAVETAQGKAEDAQDAAEAAQTAAETAQGKAEDAQTAAETAQGKAEDAQQAAEDAQTAAETAQGKAEDAQTAAETAQTAAETAQGKAEDAQDAAEAAQGAAETAQTAAEGSEDAAAASAKLSESWAKGDTGVRDGEDTNNAKYWADQSRSFSPITKADKVTGGDTDGMVAGLDAEGNLTNTGVPADNVAQKDGYYEGMTVGRAENLIDPNAPATSRKFGFDTACGDISIDDNGNAIIRQFKGTTHVVNQLVKPYESVTEKGDGRVSTQYARGTNAEALTMQARSAVLNQYFDKATYNSSTTLYGVTVTLDKTTGKISVQTERSTASFDYPLTVYSQVTDYYIVGHKYIFKGISEIRTRVSPNGIALIADSNGVVFTAETANTKVHLIMSIWNSDLTIDVEGYPMLVDLTEYFNYDQTLIDSITSWDDLVAYDSTFAAYVPYNTGEVKGLTPTVQVMGKNLINIPETYSATSLSVANRVIAITGYAPSGKLPTLGSMAPMLKAGMQVTLSVDVTSTKKGNSWCGRIYAGSIDNRIFPGDANLTANVSKHQTNTFTVTQSRIDGAVGFYGVDGGTVTFSNFQIELGSTATAYVPYTDAGTYTAPQPLHGIVPFTSDASYARYDSYDAVTGKFTQRIKSYTFTGQEAFTNLTGVSGVWTLTDFLPDSLAVPGDKYDHVLLAGYKASGATSSENLTVNLHSQSWGGSRFNIHDDSCTTVAQIQAKLLGKTLYYKLATPIVVDYSTNDISLGVGVNTAFQTAGERDATLSLKHEATEYDIQLNDYGKYIYRHDGTDELIDGGTAADGRLLTVNGASDKLIHLSMWFGMGLEPTTLDTFYKLYPTWKNYDIPYIEGYFLNYKGTGVQTIGFNAYNHETGTAELLGGNKYQICGAYESVSYVDRWGVPETLELNDKGVFTPTNNGILTVVGGNDTGTCVHLVRSGYKNYGEPDYKWEPYQKNVRELPVILEQFPEGMRGMRGVSDELTQEHATSRFTVVDLSTLNWTFHSTGTWGYWLSMDLKNSIKTPSTYTKYPAIAWTKGTVRLGNAINGTSGRKNTIGVIVTGGIQVNNGTTTQPPTGYLMYETVTPVVTPLGTPPNLVYPINDFGTEQSLPVNTTTLLSTDLDADIKYSLDFTRTVQHYSEIESDVEELVADKDHIARDYGDYPEMGAGYARNLVDPNAPGVDRLFSVDTSCGTASISDNGNGVIEEMKGRTLNWNQWNPNGAAQNGTTGWDNNTNVVSTADPDNHIMNVHFPAACQYYLGGPLTRNSKLPNGHLVYVTMWVRTDCASTMTLSLSNAIWVNNSISSENMTNYTDASLKAADGWKRISCIRQVVLSGNLAASSIYIKNYASLPNGITMSFRDCQTFDLTAMFGYGKEPRKIADFRALFPEPFYDYDAGTPMNYKGTGIKTVGFNQYKSTNEYIRVRPQPYQITGTYTSLNYSQWPLRTAPTVLTLNQVTVFNTLYSYQNTYYTALIPIVEYDATKTYKAGDVCVHEGAWAQALVDITTAEEWNAEHWTAIGAEALALTKYFHSHAMATDSEGVFTPPDFGWLYVLGGNDTDTCVHFTWSGYRNGDYEPYWESVRDIDVTRYFPDGMNGVQNGLDVASGYSGDELTATQAIQRVTSHVFTGDETFTSFNAYTSGENAGMVWDASPQRDLTRGLQYDVFNNKGLAVLSWSTSTSTDAEAMGRCTWNGPSNNQLRLVAPTSWGTYANSSAGITAFKAKLKALYDAGNPLIVWYIMKTPVVTPINPALNFTYKVADFGTEAALPPAPASFPVDAVIKYSTDYMRELTHMIEEDVRGRVDALDEQMANKADKNGDYRKEGLIANAAGNLIDANATPVPAQFSFRTTAGDASVAAQGIAEMQACRGTTHTWNQLAEDYHANTMDVFGDGQVTDAKGGALESNVFQGETIVSNQLVPDSGEAATVLLETGHSYYTKIDGVESIVTGAGEELAVTAGVDKVMDLTLAYAENRPSTVGELKSRYPGVTALAAYDRGHFVHASGGVWTTGVWNQLQSIKDSDASKTANNVTITDNRDGTYTVSTTAEGATAQTTIALRSFTLGHKILYIGAPAGCTGDTYGLGNIGSGISIGEDGRIVNTITGNNSAYFGVKTGCILTEPVIFMPMFIDLTALCGAGNEPATVEEAKAYCASIGHDLSEYQAYDAGTPLGGSVDLTGIELKGFYTNRHDMYDAETGKYTQATQICTVSTSRIASSDKYTSSSQSTYGFLLRSVLPTTCNYASYRTNTSIIKDGLEGGNGVPAGIGLWIGANSTNVYVVWKSTTADIASILPSGWTTDNDPTQPSISGFLAWLSNNPFDVIYKLVTNVTTTIQQQHITPQPGFNAFYQAPIGTLAAHNVMTYLGTEWTLKLGSGRKYLYRHNGVDTMLAPSSNMDQPIVSGDKLVDLTWLFGKTANVPATLEDCYALYPHMRGDMPYCASKMMNFTGTALRTVGFNLWDGTYSARNTYLKNDGTTGTSSGYNVTNFIRIVGGLQYEVSRVIGVNSSICWYDIDKKFISGVQYGSNGVVTARQYTAPDNACWAKFTVRDSEASICVFHLCWRGYRNYGTPGYAYEPYRESVRDMHVTNWFPDGLASDPNSGRYDELTQTKSIKRIFRKVLTGAETWTGPTAYQSNRWFSITAANIGSTNRLTGSRGYIWCNIVPGVGGFESISYMPGGLGGVCFANTQNNQALQFMLPYAYYNTVTTVAQFQAFLRERYESGDPVVIQWPLATPVETDISAEIPQLSYNYEDFGLEEIIPPNEAVPYTPPANLLIVYQKDFTRDVSNLPENYISKESMADLNAQLGSALNGTISGEYNPATGKFEFTFTRNPTVAVLAANASAPSLSIGMTYTQSPTVNVTYTLPTPSDLTQDNTIIVDVTCSNHTIAFSYNSETVAVQKPIAPTTGVKYRFICSYAFSAWKIFALEVT